MSRFRMGLSSRAGVLLDVALALVLGLAGGWIAFRHVAAHYAPAATAHPDVPFLSGAAGYYLEDGQRDSGRWTWRYDLAAVDGQTDVTLTYDWSNATPEAREQFQFPPFGVEKLTESLANLATLTT